jgi:hypothetical protein
LLLCELGFFVIKPVLDLALILYYSARVLCFWYSFDEH